MIAQRHRRPCARCLLWTQASPASLALHCAELTHRRLLSTHAEPFPSHCEKGLGVIAQRHRKSFPCPSTPPMHSCPSTSPSPPRQDKCCARWHQSRQRLSLRASASFAHQRGRISRPQPQPQARPWPVRATRQSAQVGESRRSVAPAICRGCAYYRGACLITRLDSHKRGRSAHLRTHRHTYMPPASKKHAPRSRARARRRRPTCTDFGEGRRRGEGK